MNIKVGVLILAAAWMSTGAMADSFGSGANSFTLDFVSIGNMGNTAAGNGYGAVATSYRIGMYEVTIDQFAKARAADSRLGNNNENPDAIGVNGAASNTSWLEAAMFANWLTSGDAYAGAYQIDGSGTLTSVNRAAALGSYGMVYMLPTEDEWYKAAYLKTDGSAYTTYATGNSIPVPGADANYSSALTTAWNVGSGALENNGTFDMSGNVYELTESAFDGLFDNMTEPHSIRGGGYNNDESALNSSARGGLPLGVESSTVGFRIVAIPEPTTLTMIGTAGGFGLLIRRLLGT